MRGKGIVAEGERNKKEKGHMEEEVHQYVIEAIFTRRVGVMGVPPPLD